MSPREFVLARYQDFRSKRFTLGGLFQFVRMCFYAFLLYYHYLRFYRQDIVHMRDSRRDTQTG